MTPNELNFVRDAISTIPEIKNTKHRILGKNQFENFIYQTISAAKIVLGENELLILVFLQIVIITFVYYLWIQLYSIVPKFVWSNYMGINPDSANILNFIFLAWGFLLIGIASYPISIISYSIGTSYFLKKKGLSATLIQTLKFILPKSFMLWQFLWIDGWITYDKILSRLPKRGESINTAGDELLYFSWKIGTIGILPSVLNGKNMIEAGKESVMLVTQHPQETLLLRGGYSLFCWIIGIVSIIGSLCLTIYIYIQYINHSLCCSIPQIFSFWMGVPILSGVGIILFFFRPIFVIASCRLYSEYFSGKDIGLS